MSLTGTSLNIQIYFETLVSRKKNWSRTAPSLLGTCCYWSGTAVEFVCCHISFPPYHFFLFPLSLITQRCRVVLFLALFCPQGIPLDVTDVFLHEVQKKTPNLPQLGETIPTSSDVSVFSQTACYCSLLEYSGGWCARQLVARKTNTGSAGPLLSKFQCPICCWFCTQSSY